MNCVESICNSTQKLQFTPVKDLAHKLSVVLHDLSMHYPCDWFGIASRIENVDYDIWKYQMDTMGLCEPADEYDTEKQKIDQSVVNELVIFSFIWFGFESLLNELNLPKNKNFPGKINSATFFLKNSFDPSCEIFAGYNCLVAKLKDLVANSSFEEEVKYSVLRKAVPNDYTSLSGIGLQMVYQIRNKFVHGSFSFPQPQDWSFKKVVEPKVIKLSSYITLISCQMLLYAQYKEEDITIYDYNHDFVEATEDEFDESEISLVSCLQSMHYYIKNLSDN